MRYSIVFLGKFDDSLKKLENDVINMTKDSKKDNFSNLSGPDVIKFSYKTHAFDIWVICGDVKPTLLLKNLIQEANLLILTFNLDEKDSLAFLTEGWGPKIKKAGEIEQERYLVGILPDSSQSSKKSKEFYNNIKQIMKDFNCSQYFEYGKPLKHLKKLPVEISDNLISTIKHDVFDNSLIFLGQYDEEQLSFENDVINMKTNSKKIIVDSNFSKPDVVRFQIEESNFNAWALLGDIEPNNDLKFVIEQMKIIIFTFDLSNIDTLTFLEDNWLPIIKKVNNYYQKRILVGIFPKSSKSSKSTDYKLRETYNKANDLIEKFQCTKYFEYGELPESLQRPESCKIKNNDKLIQHINQQITRIENNEYEEEEDQEEEEEQDQIYIGEEWEYLKIPDIPISVLGQFDKVQISFENDLISMKRDSETETVNSELTPGIHPFPIKGYESKANIFVVNDKQEPHINDFLNKMKIIIFTFDLSKPDTLTILKDKWHEIIKKVKKNGPKRILVGISPKSSESTDYKLRETYIKAKELFEEFQCTKYFEYGELPESVQRSESCKIKNNDELIQHINQQITRIGNNVTEKEQDQIYIGEEWEYLKIPDIPISVLGQFDKVQISFENDLIRMKRDSETETVNSELTPGIHPFPIKGYESKANIFVVNDEPKSQIEKFLNKMRIIIFTFDLSKPDTLTFLEEKWHEIIEKVNKNNQKRILVGIFPKSSESTNYELRETYIKAKALIEKFQCTKYFEYGKPPESFERPKSCKITNEKKLIPHIKQQITRIINEGTEERDEKEEEPIQIGEEWEDLEISENSICIVGQFDKAQIILENDLINMENNSKTHTVNSNLKPGIHQFPIEGYESEANIFIGNDKPKPQIKDFLNEMKIIIFTFNLTQTKSLTLLEEEWLPIIEQLVKEAQIRILVGIFPKSSNFKDYDPEKIYEKVQTIKENFHCTRYYEYGQPPESLTPPSSFKIKIFKNLLNHIQSKLPLIQNEEEEEEECQEEEETVESESFVIQNEQEIDKIKQIQNSKINQIVETQSNKENIIETKSENEQTVAGQEEHKEEDKNEQINNEKGKEHDLAIENENENETNAVEEIKQEENYEISDNSISFLGQFDKEQIILEYDLINIKKDKKVEPDTSKLTPGIFQFPIEGYESEANIFVVNDEPKPQIKNILNKMKIIIFRFNLTQSKTLKFIEEKWLPIIEQVDKNEQERILVGIYPKSSKSADYKLTTIYQKVKTIQEKLKCSAYFEYGQPPKKLKRPSSCKIKICKGLLTHIQKQLQLIQNEEEPNDSTSDQSNKNKENNQDPDNDQIEGDSNSNENTNEQTISEIRKDDDKLDIKNTNDEKHDDDTYNTEEEEGKDEDKNDEKHDDDTHNTEEEEGKDEDKNDEKHDANITNTEGEEGKDEDKNDEKHDDGTHNTEGEEGKDEDKIDEKIEEDEICDFEEEEKKNPDEIFNFEVDQRENPDEDMIINENSIIYKLSKKDQKAEIFQSQDENKEIEIPKFIEHESKIYKVVQIISEAFLNSTIGVFKMINDENITILPKSFENCISLRSITIETNETIHIKENNFNKILKLESIHIKGKHILIDKNCFTECFTQEQYPAQRQYLAQQRQQPENKIIIIEGTSQISIGNACFKKINLLDQIELKSKQIIVGDDCFDDSNYLSSFTISGSNVFSLGTNQFRKCSNLQHIELKSTKIDLGIKCFSSSSLAKVDIFGEEITIDKFCFSDLLSITEFSIKKSNIVIIDENAFAGCHNLKILSIVSEQSLHIGNSSFISLKSLKEISITCPTIFIGETCFMNCKSLSIIKFNKVIEYEISDQAFSGCDSLKELSISSYQKAQIKQRCFSYCQNLSSVILSSEEIMIDEFGFENCSKLFSLKFSEVGVLDIKSNPFKNCPIFETISIEKSEVVHFSSSCFFKVPKLSSIVINTKKLIVDENCFNQCENLRLLKFEKMTNAVFNPNSFKQCSNLQTISITKACSLNFGETCFIDNNNISSIEFISDELIFNKKFISPCSCLTKIKLDSVQNIEVTKDMFSECTSLSTLEIKSNQIKINNETFSYSTKLKYITIDCAELTIGDNAFKDCTNLLNITLNNLQSAIIGSHAFSGHSKLKNVTIKAIKKISLGDSCFYGALNLKYITLDSEDVQIFPSCFKGCKTLSSFIFKNVQTAFIGSKSFNQCQNLGNIDVSTSLSINLDQKCFCGAQCLDSVIFKSKEINIGNHCFENCKFLSNIQLHDADNSTIGCDAFYGCDALQNIKITVTKNLTIKKYCFTGAENLKLVTLSGNYLVIGDFIFKGCPSVISATIKSTIPSQISYKAFYDKPKTLKLDTTKLIINQ